MSNNEKREKKNFLFNIDFVKYMDILKQQKGFIIVFCLSAILTSLALTYILTEKFEGTTTIYYRPVVSSMLRQKNTESFGAPPPAPPFKVINQTLQDVLKSPLILEPVVLKVRLHEKDDVYYPIWYERWYYAAKDLLVEYYSNAKMILQYGRIIEEDPVLEAIQELIKNIEITATKDSYIYVLTVKDKHPKRAALIVDEAGKELVKWMLMQDKTQAIERSQQFLDQLSEKEKDIIAFRKKREELLNKFNIVSITDEATSGTQSLYQMELERVQLMSQIDEKINVISKLEHEIQNTKKYVSPDDFKKMKSEKLFEEISLKGMTAKMDSLLSSIKDLKKKVQELPALEKEIDDLDMSINSSQREFEQFKDLYLEARVESQSFQSEIRVLHPAVSSDMPVQPIKIYHVGLSALLSLFISVGLVYVFAFFNVRVFFASKGIKGRQQPSENIQT